MSQASTKKEQTGTRSVREDLTAREVAGALGLHYDTVRRLLIAGELPGYKAGPRLWRVTRAQLDAYKAGGGARKVGHPRRPGGEASR